MSTATAVERDERTVAVENASYRWAYLFMSYGLLALAAGRSLLLQQPAWDLLALVILGGALCAAYQGFHRVLTRQWAAEGLLTACAAAAVAAVMAWLR